MPSALFVRHHQEDNPGLIGEAFRARGFECDLVMMDASTPTPSIDGYDVLIVLGSSSSVNDPDAESAWFGRELRLLDVAVRSGVPIFGICFGAQALCRLFGGTVERSASPEIGWYDVRPIDDSPIETGPWFEFHYDRCLLPASATPLASTEHAVQAFSVGANLGVQFHPEIDEDQLRDWFDADNADHPREFASREELLIQTKEQTPAARARAAHLVDVFLTRVAR
jgi:GMP synthase-like glutamine amidotransferase